jgi:hypothetical protein
MYHEVNNAKKTLGEVIVVIKVKMTVTGETLLEMGTGKQYFTGSVLNST